MASEVGPRGAPDGPASSTLPGTGALWAPQLWHPELSDYLNISSGLGPGNQLVSD